MWFAPEINNLSVLRISGTLIVEISVLDQVEYKYMNYMVRLEEGAPPKDFYFWQEKFEPTVMLERFIQEHREKEIPLS
jgi:hypothetical protein